MDNVKSVQMTESCLAGVQEVLWTEGPKVFQTHLRLGKQGLRWCNPMLSQCDSFLPLCPQRPFAPSPKCFGADELISWFARKGLAIAI